MRPEFQHLIEKLDAKVRMRSDDLGKGAAKDHGEYKYAAGVIAGLKMAAQDIEEFGKAYEDD